METKLVTAYTDAVLALAAEENKISLWHPQVREISELLEKPEHLGLIKILESRKLDFNEKAKILQKLFAHRLQPEFYHLLCLIVKRQNAHYMIAILRSIYLALSEKMQVKIGFIRSVSPLKKTQIRRLEKWLEKHLKHKVILENRIDKSIIGGFIIEVGDRLINQSIRGELDRMTTEIILKD